VCGIIDAPAASKSLPERKRLILTAKIMPIGLSKAAKPAVLADAVGEIVSPASGKLRMITARWLPAGGSSLLLLAAAANNQPNQATN